METQIALILILIISVILHEMAHGYAANWLGDPTARLQGRLSPNPLVHIDPFMSVILPAILLLSGSPFLFGAAKPVPYNPYNLKNQKWGPVLVALAGPMSNLTLAFAFGMLVRFVPIASQFMANMVGLFSIIVYANVLLAVFNLMPIPPLDGSKVLYAILPDSMWKVKQILDQYGFFILIAFIFLFSLSFFKIRLSMFIK